MDQFAPAPAQTTFGELMEIHDIVSAKLQILQGTSQAESSHTRLATGKPQSYIRISSLSPGTVPNSSPIKQLKPVNAGSFYPCISPPQPITI